MDELLTLSDGTMAPLDYKFALVPRAIYHNQKIQAALYGLLISERFGVPVTRAYLCYTRSNHRIVELPLLATDYVDARAAVTEVLEVISRAGILKRPGGRPDAAIAAPKYLHSLKHEKELEPLPRVTSRGSCEGT
ncbi:MAG: hypothetical protein U0792_24090 [Gemmataceae bacterium]